MEHDSISISYNEICTLLYITRPKDGSSPYAIAQWELFVLAVATKYEITRSELIDIHEFFISCTSDRVAKMAVNKKLREALTELIYNFDGEEEHSLKE